MKEQAQKLIGVEKALSETNGPFDLFALFLREDAPNKWDLVVSSDWARNDKKKAIEETVKQVRTVFSDEEMLMLSRMIILEKDDAKLEALHRAMNVEHGLAEVSDTNLFGLAIKHAYLITSQEPGS